MDSAMLVIEVGIDPEIRDFGGLLLTWHGVFTALGIAAGVWAALVMARRLGIVDDDVYSGALIAIPAGIVGARALFVIERWNTSTVDTVGDIFRINEGGISIWGAILGGLLGAMAYAWIRKLPMLRAFDVLTFGGILGMAIGRIGDLINGEHFAEPSSLPWAIRYTHLNSPSVLGHPECGLGQVFGVPVGELCAQHPAVGYEMIGDLLIFGLAIVAFRYLRIDGIVGFGTLLLYSLMRFGVSELRLDSREIIAGLTTPQVTSLFMIAAGVVGLAYVLRRGRAEPGADRPAVAAQARAPSG